MNASPVSLLPIPKIRVTVHRTLHAVPLVVALFAPVAEAQEISKSFDYSVTYTSTQKRATVDLGAPSVAVAIEGSFVSINDAGEPFLNQMFGQCSYAFLQVGGVSEMLGGCNYEDREGDRLFETFRMTGGSPGESLFFGGTGKYQGIRCEGRFTPILSSKDRTKAIGRKTGSCRFT